SSASYAYVTFLAGNGDYVKGVVGLAKGLRKAKSAFPLVVAVLPDVPPEHRRVVAEQGCLLREIQPVFPAVFSNHDGNGRRRRRKSPFERDYFAVNFCKLRLWEFVEYDKMIYMDADIQVFDNIDHLFDSPASAAPFAGVVDCLCELHGQSCSEKLQWPDQLGPKPRFYFNGGLFIFHPDLQTYDQLMNTLQITPLTPFAEQDFLNMFFRDEAKPIPAMYNFLVAMLWRHPELMELEKVKVVHYCVPGSKPWRYTGEEEHVDRPEVRILVKKWWDIYNDESLDLK
ncbi:galactinol synthase, partial [Genlisea aurea]